jgi:hypothetical protein
MQTDIQSNIPKDTPAEMKALSLNTGILTDGQQSTVDTPLSTVDLEHIQGPGTITWAQVKPL